MYMITLFIVKCFQFLVRFMVNGIKYSLKFIWFLTLTVMKIIFLFWVFIIGLIVTPFKKS